MLSEENDILQSGVHFAGLALLSAASAEGLALASGEALPDSVAGEVAGLAAGEACGVATGSSGVVDCNTECEPVTAGNESINAINMKAAAAPIVILASTLAVPLGPKAVLEMLLENNAPASDFPGCSKTKTINITQERMNSPYKM
jgi:hypothetical protein